MRNQSWNNVSATCEVELTWDELLIDGGDTHQIQIGIIELLASINPEVNIEEECETVLFTIEFLSSGYEDPGKLSGPPEDCYPPEGEDERVLDTIALSTASMEYITVPQPLADSIFELCIDQVNSCDIDTDQGG